MMRLFSALLGAVLGAASNAFLWFIAAYFLTALESSKLDGFGKLFAVMFGLLVGAVVGFTVGVFKMPFYLAAATGAGLELIILLIVFSLGDWNVGYTDVMQEQKARAANAWLIASGTLSSLLIGGLVGGLTGTTLNLIFGARSNELLK